MSVINSLLLREYNSDNFPIFCIEINFDTTTD